MRKYEVTWFGESEDIKFFRSTQSRICVIDFDRKNMKEVKANFKKTFSFSSGLYILEGQIEDDFYFYVGESDNVWNRIQKHIDGKSNLEGKEFDRITIILSSDNFGELGKNELHFFENELISEFKSIGLKPFNKSPGYKKNISELNKGILISELNDIKRALYFVGKDKFIKTIDDDGENLTETKMIDLGDKEWVEVEPIINKKRNIKVTNGKFEFNKVIKIIKLYKDTHFVGKVDGSPTNHHILSYYLSKYITKGKLIGSFDEKTGIYDVRVVNDFWMKPSSAGVFVRGGINNGWMFWKDKKGNMIDSLR